MTTGRKYNVHTAFNCFIDDSPYFRCYSSVVIETDFWRITKCMWISQERTATLLYTATAFSWSDGIRAVAPQYGSGQALV
jgi:hypothetical protein